MSDSDVAEINGEFGTPRKKHRRENDSIEIEGLPKSIFDGLTEVEPIHPILTANELKRADSVWVFECSQDVQLKSLLKGKKLNLEDNEAQILCDSQVSDDGLKYEAICFPSSEKTIKAATIVLPSESGKMELVSFPLAGQVLVKESLEILPSVIPKNVQRKGAQLPSGIKIRHPIYGVDYEHKIPKRNIATRSKHVNTNPSKQRRSSNGFVRDHGEDNSDTRSTFSHEKNKHRHKQYESTTITSTSSSRKRSHQYEEQHNQTTTDSYSSRKQKKSKFDQIQDIIHQTFEEDEPPRKKHKKSKN